MRKLVEYRVCRGTDPNFDIDHVSWQEAKKLLKNTPPDILEIARITRYWEDDLESVRYGQLEDEEEEILFQRSESDEI